MIVSVVTPSFNQGRFIGRTLASVAGQGISGLEHVVMDGGSCDETVQVLAAAQPAVQWVSEPDAGQADALNKGFRRARGDVLGWLNSDDIYYPGAIASVLEVFDAHPDVDVVYGMADHIDVEDTPFEAYPTEAWDPDRLRDTCFICQPALFLRRSVLERFGFPNERLHYCMDYEYWLRLAALGARFHYLPRKLAGSRMYADNKTLGSRIPVHAEINDMFHRRFGLVPDRWIFNYAHAVVEPRVSRERHPRVFLLALVCVGAVSALRWNHGLGPELRATLTAWTRRVFAREASS